MANKEITGSDFENKGYDELPLDVVLGEYPKGIAPPRILSRFQNLERQLDRMEGEQAILAKNSRLRANSPLLDWTKKREEAKTDEILDFQRAYAAEMEFVYSESVYSRKIADADFAWQRLTRPGKSSRIAETVLVAQSNIIPSGKLFSSGHLDAVDRVQLASAKFELGGYVIPLRVLANYIETLPGKMRASPQSAPELLYEFNALYEIAAERTQRGSDKDI